MQRKGRLIEGFWDCDYCSTKGIRGGITICPHCGKMRGKNTKFYTSPHSQYVPDEEAQKINRNPDWVCPYCDQLNSDNDSTCRGCGAPRTADTLNYFEYQKKQQEKAMEATIEETSEAEDTDIFSRSSPILEDFSSHNSMKDLFSYVQSNFHFSLAIKVILSSILACLGIFALVLLFMPREKQLTVQELSWERSIAVERFQTVQENDWYLPTNARLLYTREEFHHYEQVIDHYDTKTREVSEEVLVGYEDYVSGTRDLGNGYFEEIISSRPIYETQWHTETYQEPFYRNDPVYQTKYYYEIDKWLYERSVRTSSNDQNPYWGEVNLGSDERESSRSSTYYMTGIDSDGKEEKITLSFDQWNTLEIGQTLTFKVSIFGNGQIMEEDLSSNAQVFFFFILSCLFFYLLNPILIPIFFDCIEYIFSIKLHFSYFTLKIL